MLRDGAHGSNNLKQWKDKTTILLTYTIKNKKLTGDRTEMVCLASEEYGLTVPGRNSFDDYYKDIGGIFYIVGNNMDVTIKMFNIIVM